jgi:hypothetical protein
MEKLRQSMIALSEACSISIRVDEVFRISAEPAIILPPCGFAPADVAVRKREGKTTAFRI